MYPRVEIDLEKIISNIKKTKELCDKNNIKLNVVTKVLDYDIDVVSKIAEIDGISISEAHIENLYKYKDLKIEKWLIAEPMQSQIEEVVKYADVSFNSEISTIKLLNEVAKKQRKIHKVILMYELGDLREGCSEKELESVVEEILKLGNIEIYGIGSNLSCYGGTIPTEAKMKELSDIVNSIEEKFDINITVVSGGNSSSYKMLEEGKFKGTRINNLRFGESIFLANVPCFEEPIAFLNKDVFSLNTQIIEIKNKESVPNGEIYVDAFGNKPVFEDKGIRKRAIIGIGKQDVDINGIVAEDKKITILGGSSNYTILDITDCVIDYKVGDSVSFKMNYVGLLRAMSSKHVKRVIK